MNIKNKKNQIIFWWIIALVILLIIVIFSFSKNDDWKNTNQWTISVSSWANVNNNYSSKAIEWEEKESAIRKGLLSSSISDSIKNAEDKINNIPKFEDLKDNTWSWALTKEEYEKIQNNNKTKYKFYVERLSSINDVLSWTNSTLIVKKELYDAIQSQIIEINNQINWLIDTSQLQK